MKKGIPFILFFCITNLCFSQSPVVEWQRALGGTGHDAANDVIQSRDGGLVMAGYSALNSAPTDALVVKLSNNGDTEWQVSFGGNADDFANSIIQTSDGGYLFAGESSSNDFVGTGSHGGYDFWILKMDSAGNLEWQKLLGGSGNEAAASVVQTMDGGYAVCGRTASNDSDVVGFKGQRDYWVVKLDNIGNLQWQTALGGPGDDFANSIIQTYDRGFVVAGSTNSSNGDVTGYHQGMPQTHDYWVVKLDSVGTLLWQKALGGSNEDAARSIVETPDSGCIVAGNTVSLNGDVSQGLGSCDYWIVKLNASGMVVWQNSYGGSGCDVATSIIQTGDGGFAIAGESESSDGNVSEHHAPVSKDDYWIVKITATGVIEWEKSVGGSGFDIPYSIIQANDGNYVLAGSTYSNDGDVSGNHGTTTTDCWVVKVGTATSGKKIELDDSKLILSPNPATNLFNIHIGNMEIIVVNIYNTSGELVQQVYAPQNNKIHIDHLAGGVYVAEVKTKVGTVMRRWIKQ